MGLKWDILLVWLLALEGWGLAAGVRLPDEAPGAELFADQPPRRLRLQIAPRHLESLRRDPRRNVPATLWEENASWSNVAVHLKGSVGSFRGVDDKPSLTLSFGRRGGAPRYHGLSKVHLNNSLEDPTRLSERVGQELFTAAGIPAPRVAWAVVELNRRKLGLYVLKEGFTLDFIGLCFTNTAGNLYEGSGHEVTEVLDRDVGTGLDDQTDLDALAAAVLERDAARRWQRLTRVVDMDRFLSFLAMEVLTGHRDGYCLARNNYRLYCDPGTGKAVFLPHGMDQLFGRPDALVEPAMGGSVAEAVLGSAEGRLRYRQRLGLLATNVLQPAALSRQISQWSARVRPAVGLGRRGAYDREVSALKDRIRQRQEFVVGALGNMPVGPSPGPKMGDQRPETDRNSKPD